MAAVRDDDQDPPVDRTVAVRSIVHALKGPVAGVFRQLIPTFKSVNGETFYAIAMSNGPVLEGCLQVFRHRRAAFAHLLVDARGRTVKDDFVRLSCGRSVHDIIAMIVRTHAKWQFGLTLGGNPNDPATPAGRLYKAMREYLIHEWQVPLVPHYGKLSAETVDELGPGLLEIQKPAGIKALVARQPARPAPTPMPMPTAKPAPVPVAKAVEPPPPPPPPPPPEPEPEIELELVEAPAVPRDPDMPANLTPQAEFWWDVLRDPQVAATLGRMDEWEKVDIVNALSKVNDATREEIFGGLMLSMPQAAVCMAACLKSLGERGFYSIFGQPGRPQTVGIIAKKMQARQLGSRTELKALYKVMDGLVNV